MMKTMTKSPLVLKEVIEHFERWRRNKKKGARIPTRLWIEAVGLVPEYTISQVCRALHLCATDLKRHQSALSPSKEVTVACSDNFFVEIDRGIVDQAVKPSGMPGLMEMERPDGLRLRIQPANSADMLVLLTHFMGVG
ncbi:MAG: hypothetical protein GY703_06310 [Gammaproteobacteria bacterium]|nr:hypothetical protein [Gammaproteobacteria bacterium]